MTTCAAASSAGNASPSCVARWRIVADADAASALADIIFGAVSSVYVNDRPAPSESDPNQEAAAL